MRDDLVSLYELAHCRSGDKGNRSNLAVIAHAPEYYPLLARALTPEAVAAHFASRAPSRVQRFDLPKLHAFNFVLDDVLEGGVNGALGLDGHGKTLSFFLLTLQLPLARDLRLVQSQRPTI